MNKALFVLLFALSAVFAGPVSWYGALTVDGNRIKNFAKTTDVQLKGPSLYWADGSGLAFYSSGAMNWFVDTMDIAVIRYAMIVQWMESGGKAEDAGAGDGYLINESNKTKHKDLIDGMVQAAIENDIYIIIDWHSHRAQDEQSAAVTFFTEMATKYKNIPNVIFEIYNEPPGGVNWGAISNYMTAVVQAIRGTGNNNLILVGSPSWSSNPNDASSGGTNALHNKFVNIAYTLHFYTGTHSGTGSSQLSNGNSALNASAAVFVSEWGATNANGGGNPDNNTASTNAWKTWMDNNKVSSCMWSASNINEGSAMFNSGTSYSVSNLSASGKIFYNYMGGSGTATLGKTNPPTGFPWGRSRTLTLNEGAQKQWSLTDLNATGSNVAFDKAEASEGTITYTNNQITFTAPQEATKASILINYWLSQGTNKSKHRITVNVNRGPRISLSELAVSKTKPSDLSFTKLGISHPEGTSGVTFTAQSVTAGTISRSADNKTLTYTPPAGATENQQVTLNYTVTANTIARPKTVILTLQNVAPTAGDVSASLPNTAPYTFSLDYTSNGVGNRQLPGSDGDDDPITVSSAYVGDGFPGTVSISADKRSITYTPAPNLISSGGARPIVYYKVSDGNKESNEGKLTLNITGSGSPIPAPVPVLPQLKNYEFGMNYLGRGSILLNFAQSGFAKLDVFSLSGKNMGNLINGNQNAGSQEVSLNALNLQKGVYILRLKQGSNTKILRIVK